MKVELRCINTACGNKQSRRMLLGVASSTGAGVIEIRCPRCRADNKFVIGAQHGR